MFVAGDGAALLPMLVVDDQRSPAGLSKIILPKYEKPLAGELPFLPRDSCIHICKCQQAAGR
jgi:hypothetical protein